MARKKPVPGDKHYLLFDESAVVQVDLPGGDATLYKGFLTRAEAVSYLSRLESGGEAITWSQETIRMFGEEHPLPRLTAWYGDPGREYTYSGIKMEPLAWTGVLVELRDRISERVGAPLNSLLCNLYRDGSDCVSWHADDEPELGPEPVIASLSLGGVRSFKMQLKDDKDVQRSVDLGHGDLLTMRGLTQQLWRHEVPRTVKKELQAPRINLTFRFVE